MRHGPSHSYRAGEASARLLRRHDGGTGAVGADGASSAPGATSAMLAAAATTARAAATAMARRRNDGGGEGESGSGDGDGGGEGGGGDGEGGPTTVAARSGKADVEGICAAHSARGYQHTRQIAHRACVPAARASPGSRVTQRPPRPCREMHRRGWRGLSASGGLGDCKDAHTSSALDGRAGLTRRSARKKRM